MIKFNMIRNKTNTLPLFLSKTEKMLAAQITEGITSSPVREIQLLQLKIIDKPFPKFIFKFFNMPENLVYSKLKAVFTRYYFDGDKLNAKNYNFVDTFSLEQMTALKAGKNLVNEKGSFLNKLVNNINKAISE